MTHVIRLRGPWRCEPQARSSFGPDHLPHDEPGPLPAAAEIRLPARWSELFGTDFFGRVRFERRFGRPGHLDPEERVQLRVAPAAGLKHVWLNNQPLTTSRTNADSVLVDITGRLQERNTLVLEVELPRPTEATPLPCSIPSQPVGDVQLEIRRDDEA